MYDSFQLTNTRDSATSNKTITQKSEIRTTIYSSPSSEKI